MVRINLMNSFIRIQTIPDDFREKPAETYPSYFRDFNEKKTIIEKIRQTDIYPELVKIGVDLYMLARQILICQQQKKLHHEAVAKHKRCKELDTKTDQNSKDDLENLKIKLGMKKDEIYDGLFYVTPERLSRMAEISTSRIFSDRLDPTRKAWFYHDFIRYCMNVIGTLTEKPYPLIFAITSLFDLRPESGICGTCENYVPGTGCNKPARNGKLVLLLRCKYNRTGSKEARTYWNRQK